jgi:tetratricopeptide (TPR) repeat protein
LKGAPGIEIRKNLIYATGAAPIADTREDKAREIARHRSQHRALQWLRFAGGCEELADSLPEKERNSFMEVFIPLMPAVRVAEVRIIGQWEDEGRAFTTIAAPAQAVSGSRCPFSGIEEGIEKYIHQPEVSLEGLQFCLAHAPRYSGLALRCRERAGEFFEESALALPALCFSREETIIPDSSVQFQFLLHRADEDIRGARRHAENGRWDEAMEIVTNTLALLPTYSPAYLLLAEYFLHQKDRPGLSLAAAEAALRDGTRFREAIGLQAACLKQRESPESEIYSFLLEKAEKQEMEGYPVQIEGFSRPHTAMADLVVNSAGRAVKGPDLPPDPLFTKALEQFQEAETDGDVSACLPILFSAISRQPASAETHNLLGACLRHLGEPMLALPFFWQAARLKPDYDLALTNLAICCHMLGQEKASAYYISHPSVARSTNPWVESQKAALGVKTKGNPGVSP